MSQAETKAPASRIYVTTDECGPRVAGRIVPRDEKGKPKVGFELTLTDAEAEYELAQGTIAPQGDGSRNDDPPPAAPAARKPTKEAA